MKCIKFTLLFSLLSLTSYSQNKDYYRSPLNIPINLAGSFGEVRPNHFHSGIDIKTNQKESYPVYAVADGYVSRLRVQIAGFGNAIYINHPNGTTSVYAHLSAYNPLITQFVLYNQYQNKSFETDFNLIPIEIPVKKGDIIAYTGNTGGSVAPHLHFEIRDTQTEETINPLSFDFGVIDHIKPIINTLTIYYLNEQPFSNHITKKIFNVVGRNGNYTLPGVINTSWEFGLGIQTYDVLDGNANKNGIYSINFYIDDTLISEIAFDKFKFEDTRSVNSYIDYAEQLTSGRIIQKTFISPGNPSDLYKKTENNGRVHLKDLLIHQGKLIITDIKGNTSTLNFKLKNSQQTDAIPFISNINYLPFNQEYSLVNNDFKILIPKNTLFENENFQYKKLPKANSTYHSLSYEIGNVFTPLSTPFNLWVKPDSDLIKKDKAVIVNQKGVYQGGMIDGDFIKASIKNFGTFHIAVDDTPPFIQPLNPQINYSKSANISFKISDNLSGIKSFNAYIDNQWVLMEYDYKRKLLWHTFNEISTFGKHTFKLVVADAKENENIYETIFYR